MTPPGSKDVYAIVPPAKVRCACDRPQGTRDPQDPFDQITGLKCGHVIESEPAK